MSRTITYVHVYNRRRGWQ